MSCHQINLIFDIDETLVHYLKNEHWARVSEDEQKKYQTIRKNPRGIFVLRPYLREFLEFCVSNGINICLWTWSENSYAQGVAGLIKEMVGVRPTLIFSEKHASRSAKLHGHSKDLNMLWYGHGKLDAENMEPDAEGEGDVANWSLLKEKEGLPCFAECNTILIDDLPSNSVNKSNRKNSITINPFALFGEVKDRSGPYNAASPTDTSLLDVMEILKRVAPAAKCYGSDDQWTNIFDPENIKKYGLQDFVKRIRLTNKKTKETEIVSAIGVGNSHFFEGVAMAAAGGAGASSRKTRRRRQRSRKNNTRHR